MSKQRFLIVNADDFGLSAGVNRGIIQCHRAGILTSASLMVRSQAAAQAASLARENPRLSVGLHLDLGEWVYAHDEWVPKYQVVPPDNSPAVLKEVTAQIDSFRRLMGKNPTHLDSHQHVHRDEPARSVMVEFARKFDVCLRDVSPEVHYCGAFYGQSEVGAPLPELLTLEALEAALASLPHPVIELGCHPGFTDDLDQTMVYRAERELELRVLCDPRARAMLANLGFQLRSFHDIQPGPGKPI